MFKTYDRGDNMTNITIKTFALALILSTSTTPMQAKPGYLSPEAFEAKIVA
jgi:hypothetical protein